MKIHIGRVALEKFEIYFLDKKHRTEALSLFLFRHRVDWTEEGLAIASWSFIEQPPVEAVDIKDAYKKCRAIKIDKRSKNPRRGMSIGDVIISGGNAWMVITVGFLKLPDIIWQKTYRLKEGKKNNEKSIGNR